MILFQVVAASQAPPVRIDRPAAKKFMRALSVFHKKGDERKLNSACNDLVWSQVFTLPSGLKTLQKDDYFEAFNALKIKAKQFAPEARQLHKKNLINNTILVAGIALFVVPVGIALFSLWAGQTILPVPLMPISLFGGGGLHVGRLSGLQGASCVQCFQGKSIPSCGRALIFWQTGENPGS